jgi:translocation and assembly module TamA
LGGSSVFEVGAEVRIKLWGPWGIAPFIEGGNVFDTAYPDFSGSLRWGAGLGIRYYTPFGPIRLDVATPLNPRASDSDFHIYVSIGQSF